MPDGTTPLSYNAGRERIREEEREQEVTNSKSRYDDFEIQWGKVAWSDRFSVSRSCGGSQDVDERIDRYRCGV